MVTPITSPDNATVKAARKLARRRGRARSGALLVEGPQVLAEAGAFVEQVFLAEDADAAARAAAQAVAARGAPLTRVSAAVLATVATSVAPRGVVGVARLPHHDLDEVLTGSSFLLLCAQVADPGNLGTIVRAADAAGADAVLVGVGSVDPGNPKAVRASAGSLFHLPVLAGLDAVAVVAQARRAGVRTVAADASGPQAHTAADLSAPLLLVLGGEAHGLSDELRRGCDALVRVPMANTPRPGFHGVAESLNLAATAAVLAFDIAHRRAGELTGKGTG